MSVVRHWNRLSRKAVDAASLAVFKVRLDGALSNLILFKISLSMAEVRIRWSLKVTFNSNQSIVL